MLSSLSILSMLTMEPVNPPAPGAVKVLFIVGYPRSGSTVLGAVLNELAGFEFVGEMRYLGELLRNGQRRCGCGTPIGQCAFWQSVLAGEPTDPDGLGGSVAKSGAEAFAAFADRQDRFGSWLRLALGRAPWPRRVESRIRARRNLYRAVARRTGFGVLVDSSKLPVDAAYLAATPGIDAYFLHLVRDPRGPVYSRQRGRDLRLREDRHPRPLLAKLRKLLMVRDAFDWARTTLAVRLSLRRVSRDRVCLLRYEDFAARPEREVRRIVAWVEPGTEVDCFSEESTVVLGENHSVSGNRTRFLRGETRIREDRAWSDELSGLEQALVTACAGAGALGLEERGHRDVG